MARTGRGAGGVGREAEGAERRSRCVCLKIFPNEQQEAENLSGK